ncbi:protein EMBRYO DEFECTIVE 514 [Cajanus cajan]|nr:protein EMBRYO DEFECTIVE 514 [Cajanus cajan]
MAEDTVPEVIDPITAVDMEVESEPTLKRAREEEESHDRPDDDVSKKQKLDEEKSVEEQRLERETIEEKEKEAEKEEEKEEEKEASGAVNLGHKSFGSSSEMFHYFYNFLHTWPQYLNVNKYEHLMLLELLKNGHAEPDKKIGGGVRAFQVRKHPTFKSRCFFLIREDESVDDFSFRKCVDHILPMPEEMHLKSNANKASGGGSGGGKHHGHGKGGRGRGGRGGGRGRGGKWRN